MIPIEIFERHVNNIRPSGKGQYMGLCPFHDDRHPSFSFSEEGMFLCFGCEVKGNAYQFAEMVGEKLQKGGNTRVSLKKAKVWSMPGVLEVNFHNYIFKANDELLLNYDQHVEWLPWNKEIVKKLFVGWDDGFVFPYLNGSGQLVNIKWHKKRQVTGHAQTFIYPFWHMMEKYKKNKPLYVVEGEKDCISMISSGRQAITFNNGANSNVPPVLVSLLKTKFSDLVVKFDNDEAGKKAEEKILKVFNAS